MRAMNIRRGAIATDFHCAIRNRISCIIHTITESMKRNQLHYIVHMLHGMYTKRLIYVIRCSRTQSLIIINEI